MQEKGFWGELNRDLGVSYVAIALSDFAKIEDAQLVVLVYNKRESVSRRLLQTKRLSAYLQLFFY